MIPRKTFFQQLQLRFRSNRVVGLIGPRQVGKSTLASEFRSHFRGPTTLFDLEDPKSLARLEDPGLVLRELQGLVVLDEIQRLPEVFPLLRVLADRKRPATRFLVLGSASPHLLRQTSESLAGRITYLELPGLLLSETGTENLDKLWLRGGFPRSFLARTASQSMQWRQDLIETYLRRDLPELGIQIPGQTLRRFWTMLAHYHGQVWNASELAKSFGVAHTTVRRYLEALVSTFLVRSLAPWHENLKKRQVKAPKVYINDSGLLHALLNLAQRLDLESHPKLGASWEGFLLDQVVRRLQVRPDECYFWATHGGAELDLLVIRGRKRWGFEFKRTEAPRITKSMRIAAQDLGLSRLYLVHAGSETFPLGSNMVALSSHDLTDSLRPW